MARTTKTKKGTTVGRKYTVYYQRDRQAGGFTAHIPALGIVTEGESRAEARAMARDAVEGRIAVLKELGQAIPDDVTPEYVEI
jgi:antitoxin HicB